MATEAKPNIAKVKPSSNQGDSSAKNKRVESSNGKQLGDPKQKSFSLVTKTEVKSKTSGSSKTTTTTTAKAREKKVYSLFGQRYDPPEEREPLRIFYESLSKQIPSSEMAEFWMMEHGLLSPDRAKKAYEKKQKKQKMQRMGTPIKTPKTLNKPESSQKQQQASKNGDVKAKKKILHDTDDDDFVLSSKRRKIQ